MLHRPHRFKPRRLRKDGVLMFMCAFGIIGGLIVLKSFAQSPIDATKPGRIDLKANGNTQRSESTFNYSVKTTAGFQYCFWGTHASKSTVVEQTIRSGQTLVTNSATFNDDAATPQSLICFQAADNSIMTVRLKISGTVDIQSLQVD